jgi:phosphoenolpyruvate---glycerone phosphotransferase subunit DhaL
MQAERHIMDRIGREELIGLFRRLREVFAERRDFLIELDGRLGDSDLGITMNKGFNAASEWVEANASDDLGKTLNSAGLAFAKAAPSTMGTLTATGFMRGGKALAGRDGLETEELLVFWRAFRDGVAERGKAKPGDKTILDVLEPIVSSFEASVQEEARLIPALESAAAAAERGLDGTKAMKAQHGKAAVYQEKSIGFQDAGATVGYLIVSTMLTFAKTSP